MVLPLALLLVGCPLLAQAVPAPDLGDSVAAVQSSVQAHRHQAEAQAGAESLVVSRLRTLSKLQANQSSSPLDPFTPKPFDCKAYPRFCRAPFNCQTWSPLESVANLAYGMAAGGKANLRSWCESPKYEPYVATCLLDHDLVKAGEIQYEWTIKQHMGIEELDGSYCFIEGHCSNEAVTNRTTLEESYQMCDDRYGHDGWIKQGSLSSVVQSFSALGTPGHADIKTGFHSTQATTHFLKAACAMGNYHCDVMYCKVTYCKMPYYIQKYGHLLPKAPGHLLQRREHL